MFNLKKRDGFAGEKQINIPEPVLDKKVRAVPFLSSLYITHIGYFPKAQFHYRERKKGCADNILIYCLGGMGFIEAAGEKFELCADQFTILPAGEPHRYQAGLDNPWTIYWLHFSGSQLSQLNEWLNTGRFLRANELPYEQRIVDAWHEMFEALAAGMDADNIHYANFLLQRFMSFFIFPRKSTPPQQRPDRLEESVSYMKANIGKRFSVEEIAAHVQLSTSYYSMLFRTRNGLSPMEYFIRMKIQHSCELLAQQQQLRVREVAEKVGYQDPYFFSRLFSKQMGMSPAAYRAKYAAR